MARVAGGPGSSSTSKGFGVFIRVLRVYKEEGFRVLSRFYGFIRV